MPTTVLATVNGLWVNGVEYDAAAHRLADAALIAAGGIAHGLEVTVNASDEVTVTAGSVIIDGEAAASGTGVYRAGLPADAGPTLLEGRDATYSRIDLVVFRQYDPAVEGVGTDYEANVEVIAGEPAASPSAPGLPDLAVELARVTVPVLGGGAPAVDSSHRKYATAVHRPLFVHASAESSATPGPSTTWATVSGGIARTFTAPASGRVKVTAGAYLYQSKAGERQLYGYKLSGGTTRDPLDSETVQVYGTSALSGSRVYVLSGLTPGTSYTLTEAYRTVNTTAGTAYMASRSLIIEGA